MRFYVDLFRDVQKFPAKPAADRHDHLAMDRSEAAEKSACPPECFVNKLVDNNKVSGVNLFAQRADGAAAYYRVNAQFFQGKYVGCKRDLGGRKFVAVAVAIDKCYLPAADSADHNIGAGPAERRFDIAEFCISYMPGQCIAKTRSADYANQFFCHFSSVPVKLR
jgi:hypothetical protein